MGASSNPRCSTSHPANVPGKAMKDGQVLEPLHSTWEIQKKLLALAWSSPHLGRYLGSEQKVVRSFCRSLSFSVTLLFSKYRKSGGQGGRNIAPTFWAVGRVRGTCTGSTHSGRVFLFWRTQPSAHSQLGGGQEHGRASCQSSSSWLYKSILSVKHRPGTALTSSVQDGQKAGTLLPSLTAMWDAH